MTHVMQILLCFILSLPSPLFCHVLWQSFVQTASPKILLQRHDFCPDALESSRGYQEVKVNILIFFSFIRLNMIMCDPDA